MRIIISPAKKMVTDPGAPQPCDLPTFLHDAETLKCWINALTYREQKALWRCSDAIARKSADRFAHMDLTSGLTPALLAYDGIQYSYMAPTVFEDEQLAYVQSHLRILSGFYGVLRPMDGVVPYRLEMQAKAAVNGSKNLYEYWGRRLYDAVMDKSHVLVNLASKEYSKAVERYLEPTDRYITCVFGELSGDRVIQKGVYAKIARGEMVRHLATICAEEPEQMRTFTWSGYAFNEARSTNTTYVFLR